MKLCPNAANECRCHWHESIRRGYTIFDYAAALDRLRSVGEYAVTMAASDPMMEAAGAQMRLAIERERKPTACDMHDSCTAVSGSCLATMRYACFGCPNRRTDTPFLPRSAW